MPPKVLATKITLVDLDAIKEHPENPNLGDEDSIAESIEENDFTTPLLVQRSTGFILAGHARRRSARRLGMPKVPVIYLDVDDARALRILLADNQTARRAVYDDEVLVSLLSLLKVEDKGLLGTGFDDADLEALLAGNVDPDPLDDRPKQVAANVLACPACGHEWATS